MSPSASPTNGTRHFARALLIVNIVGLIGVAVWFRCWSLGNIPGINGDEAWYGAQAMELLHGGTPCLRTPPGNPLNPFFFVPLVLLHVGFAPSVAVLRAVALVSGLAALALNWLLCGWVFDRRTALISTIALAVLPVNIAYSRFAWDASQSLLATLPVLYCSLAAVRFPQRFQRLLAAAILALLAAVWVHPANIFAGAAIAVAAANWPKTRESGEQEKKRRFLGAARFAAVAAVAAIALAIWAASVARMQGPSPASGRLDALIALLRPAGMARCLALYARLFCGETIYQYIAGSHSWLAWPAADNGGWGIDVIVFWIMLVASAGLLLRGDGGLFSRPDGKACREASPRKKRPVPLERNGGKGDRAHFRGTSLGAFLSGERKCPPAPWPDRALVATWLLQGAAFAVLAGPMALVPGQERYAICLIAPAIVLMARGLARALSAWPRGRPAILAAACMLGWFLLADYHQHYFRCIQRTGGEAHSTFRTAPIEPKQAALDYIRGHRRPGTTWIITSEWWNYQPLRYLAMPDDDIRVITPPEAGSVADLARARDEGRVWYVEFADSEGLQSARSALAGRKVQEHVITDFAGRPVLCVLY